MDSEDALSVYHHKRKPVIKPKANPNIIGNGKPGKMPFFSSMKNVMMEPAMMPMIDTTVGRILGRKLKNMTPVNIE